MPAGPSRIHLVGAGGTGMSALAAYLQDRGSIVTGSDLRYSRSVVMLRNRGMHVARGHDRRNLPSGAQLVIRSLAVPETVPELEAARARRLPLETYPQALARIGRDHHTIGVAGTHGKTTTSALLGHLLLHTGQDPSWIFGGAPGPGVQPWRAGGGKLLVLESCEYARSFLNLPANLAIITSVDNDHLDCYGDLAGVQQAFLDYALQVTGRGGRLVLGCGDPLVRCLEERGVPPEQLILCSVAAPARWRARSLAVDPRGMEWEVWDGEERAGQARLPLWGQHNLQNALLAVAAAGSCGVDPTAALEALASFGGTPRRMQCLGQYRGATVYDDYAHHPTEVRATLRALRAAYPGQRLVAVFEPHLVSRTRQLQEEFVQALALADLAAVTEIYAARGAQVNGYSGTWLAQALGERGRFVPGLPEVRHFLARTARRGDVVVMMGAGDIGDAFAELTGATDGT